MQPSWYSKCREAKKCEFIPAIKVKLSIHTYVSPPSRMSDVDTADAGVRHRAPHHSRSPTRSRSPRRQCSSTPRISRSVTESPAPRQPWRRWRNRRRRRGQGQVSRLFLRRHLRLIKIIRYNKFAHAHSKLIIPHAITHSISLAHG